MSEPKPQWTPGPWRHESSRDQIVASNGSLIATVATGEDRSEEDANARLIASAPDMAAELATLRAQVAQLRKATQELVQWFRAPQLTVGAFSTSEHLLAGDANELAVDVDRARAALSATERSVF